MTLAARKPQLPQPEISLLIMSQRRRREGFPTLGIWKCQQRPWLQGRKIPQRIGGRGLDSKKVDPRGVSGGTRPKGLITMKGEPERN